MKSGRSRKPVASDQTIDVQAVDLEPTRRGFQVTYNYSIRFWLPMLGAPTFAVWQTLISFCYGDKTTCYPSITLIADIATDSNRKLITGRWRGHPESRRRQPGALEHLEAHGLLTVETKSAGPTTRHVFHVLKEPPLLTPEQLASLPDKLQQMHSDLLARCGMDQTTYRDLSTSPHDTGARGTTAGARGTTPGARGTTNQYERRRLLEELWRETKTALALKMTDSNYRTYISQTHALAFQATDGILIIEAPNPLTSLSLQNQFYPIIIRTVHELDQRFEAVAISQVQFQSRR